MRPGSASESVVSKRLAEIAASPYQDVSAHWQDLLGWLDACVQRVVNARRAVEGAEPASGAPWLRLVAASEREVATLLQPPIVTDTASTAYSYHRDHPALASREAATHAAGGVLPLFELARLFGLSALERDTLVIACAPDLEARYARLFGYLHDDLTRQRATPALIFELLDLPRTAALQARSIFSPHAPLRRYQLLRFAEEGAESWMTRALTVEERILSYVTGEGGMDARVTEFVTWPRESAAETSSPWIARLTQAVEECRSEQGLTRKPVFYLHGAAGMGKRHIAQAVAERLGLPLMIVDSVALMAATLPWRQAWTLLFREGLLTPAVLYLRDVDRVLQGEEAAARLQWLTRSVADLGGVTFLAGETPWSWPATLEECLFLTIDVGGHDAEAYQHAWQREMATIDTVSATELSTVTNQYRLSPRQVRRAARMARDMAAFYDEPVSLEHLRQSARAQVPVRPGGLGRLLAPRHTWEDLILPPSARAPLQEMCDQARLGQQVYGVWGMGRRLSYGRGLHVLFSGPPGTGKTLAAEVVAQELRLDVLKIDLSQVVSKYIGETEKNLHRAFEQAQQGGAILFFDEADALFGKRSEVKDAHDRYSNIETAYLLQKMEEFEGITILASNLRANMDDAFVRRMNFIIEFPFPEEEFRARIWHSLLPAELPRAEDVDLHFLARQFKLTGGNIKNIVVAAAFLAAAENGVLTMRHLILATKREYQKLGWMCGKADFGPWYEVVADGA